VAALAVTSVPLVASGVSFAESPCQPVPEQQTSLWLNASQSRETCSLRSAWGRGPTVHRLDRRTDAVIDTDKVAQLT